MGVFDVINHHSRYRKLVCILGITSLLTYAYLSMDDDAFKQAAMIPYATAMTLLGFAYVVDSVLRILAERIPLPRVLGGGDGGTD